MNFIGWLLTDTEQKKKSKESSTNDLIIPTNKKQYIRKYNWMLSYPMKKYSFMDDSTVQQFSTITLTSEGTERIVGKKYIDLRPDCPNILEDRNLHVSPISTICFILHYQLIRNKLDIFPPSRLFIYHNLSFFKDVSSIFTFDAIFHSIETHGFCSELSYVYSKQNISTNKLTKYHYDEAEQYKFINIYRVPNSIEMIKQMLRNSMIIAIGFVLYNNIHINSTISVADTTTNTVVGGTVGAIVGYIEQKQSFIIAVSYGKKMGKNGYILLPYTYVENKDLVPELYYIDFDVTQIQNFIVNKKKMKEKMKENMKKEAHTQQKPYGGLFN
tara:strand:- start:639 stop:1622 length:984 start_codon:yes stop_codon:yes gene_type:complete